MPAGFERSSRRLCKDCLIAPSSQQKVCTLGSIITLYIFALGGLARQLSRLPASSGYNVCVHYVYALHLWGCTHLGHCMRRSSLRILQHSSGSKACTLCALMAVGPQGWDLPPQGRQHEQGAAQPNSGCAGPLHAWLGRLPRTQQAGIATGL